MKTFSNLAFIALFTFISLSANAQTDQKYESLTFVLSQNKCHFNNISDLNEMTIKVTGPILNELVAEGMLVDWGILSHDWGDEWNFNNYYVAEDKNKFNIAWEEYVKRVRKKDNLLWKKFGEYCTEHKDNIYYQSIGSKFALPNKASAAHNH